VACGHESISCRYYTLPARREKRPAFRIDVQVQNATSPLPFPPPFSLPLFLPCNSPPRG
jgi:hypothetical protein